MKKIGLAEGGGGSATNKFIKELFISRLGNDASEKMPDAAHVETDGRTAFTTDGFVVRPEFFPGGNIGKLAVCGTVNDLAVSGAKAEYLSLGVIIPEGYEAERLEKIVDAIAETAKRAGVKIVCGDTKVVEKGAVDGLFINTAGIGRVVNDWTVFENIKDGDAVILTSDMARHGMSVLLARGELGFEGNIESDCAPLNKMLEALHEYDVHFCRDATRGGVAAVLNEIADGAKKGFLIHEADLPLRQDVGNLCEILGFDPLSVANEGLAVILVSASDASHVIEKLKNFEEGRNACVVGFVNGAGRVILETAVGGRRVVDMPAGELLPRIC
ncbi:hydrogenase expression/formation protein HypE [Geovibrio thiophilus]|uniref:Hydrogenase expression/formation protein HypE n=1 Tax=Geovibrio thiophilus TaxID=139438 RepID=A0A3R5YY81_9BACT|nr:hydrogenase expression/formation protein HypE [Geovibrio thiophilus]QAR32373.1 hydrogenase expression/formation protein HypE [Geovibrio thiophilus]